MHDIDDAAIGLHQATIDEGRTDQPALGIDAEMNAEVGVGASRAGQCVFTLEYPGIAAAVEAIDRTLMAAGPDIRLRGTDEWVCRLWAV